MSPFQLRLEILKMAREMLCEEHQSARNIVDNNWHQHVELAKQSGQPSPVHPGYPAFPSEQQIIASATTLNNFVSQIPLDTVIKVKKSV